MNLLESPNGRFTTSGAFRRVWLASLLALGIAAFSLGCGPAGLVGVGSEEPAVRGATSNAQAGAESGESAAASDTQAIEAKERQVESQELAMATFGGGCFWCTEAVFEEMRGVKEVVSGYSGGQVENPTYQAVCTGSTGHAEVVQIKYDPQVTTFAELLEVFFRTHDPTTLNRQGNDTGTQYRSVIYYHNDEQKREAEQIKKELDASEAFPKPIVTEISALEKFYPAEDYHQDYYAKNPSQSYCAYVVGPKVEKFRKVFRDKLKSAK